MKKEMIDVQLGDLTKIVADAIVNPANSFGKMGGGVAGAIKRAGGAEIEKEAVARAPIPVGTAVATTAGRLAARYVIHAPTMEKPTQRTTIENIKRAVQAALETADHLNVKSLAFPGMGTGVGRVPRPDAALAIVSVLLSFEATSLKQVLLVDRNKEMVQAFRGALEKG
ncbi:MAG: macro domain-containing protein [Calditrichaeota bacterium]|nr:macro domain-containing protein [Calditrichota bacterium]